jgi:hypothetical protein
VPAWPDLVVVVAGANVGGFVACPPADAAFSTSVARTGDLTAATLQPPTSLTATPNGSLTPCGVTIAWTASTSAFKGGYTLQRFKAGVADAAAVNLGAAATSYLDNSGVVIGTAYTWNVYATASSWTSTTASVAKTPSVLCQ